MKQNIKNNNTRNIASKLYSGNYYDFMLFKGETKEYNKSYLDSLSIADFSALNIKNGCLYSDKIWDKAINDGIELNNIGFTGIDNGLIAYRKDRVSNTEFLNLFLKSNFKIDYDDKRLFMAPITGNTLQYTYPIFLKKDNEKYLACKGGFFQGFFKLYGNKYQVLPDEIEDNLMLHFELRPRSDYQIETNTINHKHPNNKGIFFYIGTRAENKFWEYYEKDLEILEQLNKNESSNIKVCSKPNINDYIKDDYMTKDIIITDDFSFTDSKGREHNIHGYNEIETDNKFLLFDRTKDGYTINNWVEGSKAKIVDINNCDNPNYFLLMNKTKTGYTINTIDSYKETHIKSYDLYKDIINNAFALRINENGAIGYRYIVSDECNNKKISILEEYSKDDIVEIDKWNNINVKFVVINKDKMKILFYVNGNLVLVSKDIQKFNLKNLNDVAEKQECVPYNISLGGGSIGLMEAIYPNYYDIPKYILPIENYFCGSFIGDIKSFKMYNGNIDYSIVKDYLS